MQITDLMLLYSYSLFLGMFIHHGSMCLLAPVVELMLDWFECLCLLHSHSFYLSYFLINHPLL